MHETSVTKAIFETVMKFAQKNNVEKVIAVHMDIGEMSDLQEIWIQKFFDYFSKGTIAEGAKVVVDWQPVIFQCDKCDKTTSCHLKEVEEIMCGYCGNREMRMVSGKQYIVKAIDVY